MRNSIRKRSASSRENLMFKKKLFVTVHSNVRWVKQAWPAKPIYSILTIGLEALLLALTYAIKQGFFLLLICCLLRYLYTIKQNDKIPSLKKSEKTQT